MKTAYDLKSFLIGVILTAFVVFTLGATKDESPQVGRFRAETNRNHVFVIDIVTGQVWEKCVKSTGGATSENFAEPKLRSYKKSMVRKLLQLALPETNTTIRRNNRYNGLLAGYFKFEDEGECEILQIGLTDFSLYFSSVLSMRYVNT